MKYAFLILFSVLFFSSCFFLYTFKDISISPDVKTYYVDDFDNTAFGSPATLSQDFSEELRGKVRKETSLVYDDTDPQGTASSTHSVLTNCPRGMTKPVENTGIGYHAASVLTSFVSLSSVIIPSLASIMPPPIWNH